MNRIGAWANVLGNQSVDFYRDRAKAGELNDLYVLLHHGQDPSQQAIVDANLNNLYAYRSVLEPLGVKFFGWVVCGEEARSDGSASRRILRDHLLAGIVANAEKLYESDGFKRSSIYLEALGVMAPGTLAWSPEGTPAEIAAYDYRAWELAGASYLAQSYWNTFDWCTPKTLVKSAYLPDRCQIGWNYRLWIRGKNPRWGLLMQVMADDHAVIRDLKSRVVYTTPIVVKYEGTYKYFEFTTRVLSSTENPNAGKILGFFPRGRIIPNAPTYSPRPSAQDVADKFTEARVHKGSIYLGELAFSTHFSALSGALL